MSNIVDFKRPPKNEEPKKPDPGSRKLLTMLAVVAALVLVWLYFHYIAGPG